MEPCGFNSKSGVARSRYDEVWGRPRYTAQCGCCSRARIHTGTTPALVLHLLRKTHSNEFDRVGQGEAARRHRGLPLPRPEAHLGLLARAERHFTAGADGTRGLEVVRDGTALCAPGPGETLLRGRPHRAAAIKIRRRSATGQKRSKKRYVCAAVGALRFGKFLINWCARRDSNSRPPGS